MGRAVRSGQRNVRNFVYEIPKTRVSTKEKKERHEGGATYFRNAARRQEESGKRRALACNRVENKPRKQPFPSNLFLPRNERNATYPFLFSDRNYNIGGDK